MGHHGIWRTEPDGVLAAEADRLRLVVQAPERVGGAARFLVPRRDGEGRRVLLGSGTGDNVRAAIEAAARMAERIMGQPFGPG